METNNSRKILKQMTKTLSQSFKNDFFDVVFWSILCLCHCGALIVF